MGVGKRNMSWRGIAVPFYLIFEMQMIIKSQIQLEDEQSFRPP